MPAKNAYKIYAENSFYHLYNRGVEKRKIFKDEQDYKVFLKYLREYLSPPPDPKNLKVSFVSKGQTFKGVPRLPRNYTKEIGLVAFCLMPNHFHLLIKQADKNSMQRFMQSLVTRYSMYFNKRYDRVGTLFQGRYKAVLVKDEPYLLHLSRYIHLNPEEQTSDIKSWYSSYSSYLGERKLGWLRPEIVLSFFNQTNLPFLKRTNTYKDFVEKYQQDSERLLGNLTLE